MLCGVHVKLQPHGQEKERRIVRVYGVDTTQINRVCPPGILMAGNGPTVSMVRHKPKQ